MEQGEGSGPVSVPSGELNTRPDGILPSGDRSDVRTLSSAPSSSNRIIDAVAAAEPEAEPEAPGFVFAVGQIEWRSPSPDVEREIAHSIGRADTAGRTDHQALQAALSERSNRYLVRELCWLFSIKNTPTYILRPRAEVAFDQLLEAVRADPSPLDLDVVIGVRGPLAPPQLCNGLELPIVVFDQLFVADREALLREIPRPDSIPEDQDAQFRLAAAELFDFVSQPDNAGATDEDRALNFLLTRSGAIYGKTAELQVRDSSLTAVEVRPSRLTGARKLVDVIVNYTNRNTDVVERYRATVDVAGKYPYLHTRLSPYYDRSGL